MPFCPKAQCRVTWNGFAQCAMGMHSNLELYFIFELLCLTDLYFLLIVNMCYCLQGIILQHISDFENALQQKNQLLCKFYDHYQIYPYWWFFVDSCC